MRVVSPLILSIISFVLAVAAIGMQIYAWRREAAQREVERQFEEAFQTGIEQGWLRVIK